MKKELENPMEEDVKELIEESIENPTEKSEKELIEELTETPKEEIAKEPIETSMEESSKDEYIETPTEKLTEEPIKDTRDEPIENEVKNYKKIAMIVGFSICTLLIIYLGISIYFTSHFNFGTKINNIDISGKSVEDAKEVMESALPDYTLNLKDREGKIQQIKATDINLRYNSDEEFIDEFKDRQNPFKWIVDYFNKDNTEMTVGFSYNDELLKKQIDKLPYFNSSNIIEPKNPSFKYIDNSYSIVDGNPGNKIDKDLLYSSVVNSLRNGEFEIDLESLGCYIKPEYDSKSKKTIEVRDTLNKYVSSKVIYTFGDKKEILDGSIINEWLKVDEKFEVIVDEEKVKNYLDELSKKYNTVGKTRDFVTSLGKSIKIGGGDYGFSIDKTKETQSLISVIKEGKSITKEPQYNTTAFSYGKNDIGNTYVEIDLTNQHMWFYKNGSLIVQGDIVTGNVQANHTTPPGVYILKYKARNVVLRGPGYAAPVTFWMPFNGGIGIHDASWRSVFGGNIYKTNGSHGCINSPYNVAKAIFNNIEPGTPVICY